LSFILSAATLKKEMFLPLLATFFFISLLDMALFSESASKIISFASAIFLIRKLFRRVEFGCDFLTFFLSSS